MWHKLLLCAVMLVVLAGCKIGGDDGSSSGFGGGSGSSILGSGSATGGSFGGGSGAVGGGSPISGAANNPEPATMALFATGLAAYAFLKRRKK